MNKIKYLGFLIAGLAILLPGLSARGQNDVLLTQSWAVPTYYNPAATGSTDFVRIRGGARLQWVGIENAPKSFLACADMPFQFGKQRIGIGADMSNESLGLFRNTLVNIQASYKRKFLKGTLSIGIQGGYYSSAFKGSEVYLPEGDDYHQGVDEAIPTQDVAGHTFDLSAGLYYSHKYFNVGISGLHLLDPTVRLDKEGSEGTTSDNEVDRFETRLSRTLYFTADGNIPLRNTLFELQPALLIASDFDSWNAQVDLRARYRKFISVGLGYRWKEALNISLAAEFKNFFLGYSYGYPLSAISKASSGTHEIILGYQIKLDFSGVNRHRHKSIRLM